MQRFTPRFQSGDLTLERHLLLLEPLAGALLQSQGFGELLGAALLELQVIE